MNEKLGQEIRWRNGRRWCVGLATIGLALVPLVARAQVLRPVDPADRARIRFGPFYLHPTIAVVDMGVDTNVGNTNADPQEDFTATIRPTIDFGMRAGPARLSIVDTVDFVWYRELEDERAINGDLRGELEIRWNRLRPFVSGDVYTTSAREGDEIDARARRKGLAYGAGVDIGIASRTWALVEYRRRDLQYFDDEFFEGVNLGRALNGTTDSLSAGTRFELTPLTTFEIVGRVERVRFDTASFRDSDSEMVLATFRFDPDALVSGTASVGYRRLRGEAVEVPDYRGPTASVGLVYAALPSTRLDARVNRDVAYSFQDRYPYYVSTSVNLAVTQRIAGPFELIARGRRTWLDYRPLDGQADPRTDRLDGYGGGLGIRFGDFSRLGFEIERVERRSDETLRRYQGTRYFGSVNYGF